MILRNGVGGLKMTAEKKTHIRTELLESLIILRTLTGSRLPDGPLKQSLPTVNRVSQQIRF